MKNRKGLTITGFIVIILLTAAWAYVSLVGVGSTRQGSMQNIKLGLDLAGGVSITYEANQSSPSAEDMSDTVYKLLQRVQVYSTEAEVYQEGLNRINVDIPGVYDAEEVLASLGNPGTIGFYEYVAPTADESETESETAETENETGESEATGEISKSSIPDGMIEVMTGDDIVDAQVATQNNSYGNSEYVVKLVLSSEGAAKFSEATARNIGNPIYIIYDGKIISYPTVNQQISGGQAVITGNFTYESANSLATTIRLGVLKLTLSEVRSNVVGAKLGEEAVETSIMAGLVGLILVFLFMIVFYRIPGVASGIALILYLFITLCFLNALNVTLTLPGIAGIILSIGMAVDANVIIFTRIREEITLGKSVRSAINEGFSKALSAILDGNITTLIAAAVLYLMGTGSIRGFATTLALGIVLSMVTALFITRAILLAFYTMGLKDEKFYGRQKEFKTIRFTKHKFIYYAISLAAIAAGLIAMAAKSASGESALNYSLDFTGGTSMTVEFNEYMDVTSPEWPILQEFVAEYAGTNDIQMQNVTSSNEIIIKTPVLDSEHRSALKAAFAEHYQIDESSIQEESISAVVSSEMKWNALLSILISSVFMLIYIWIRFKDVKFGASAVLALLHDVLVVLTVYAVIRLPVGNTFIACMLTIVGYSINATIVIFDRIRENRNALSDDLDVIVDRSITQTLSRSINTSLTTLITIGALYVMGVSAIKEFALPLMAGIVCGAFSSVCISGTLWYIMKKRFSKKESK